MRAVGVLALLIAGCGRLGFAPLADDPGNGGDDVDPAEVDGGIDRPDGSDSTGGGTTMPTSHFLRGGTAGIVAPTAMFSAMTGTVTGTDLVLVVAVHWRDATSSVSTVQDGFGNGFTMIGAMRRYNAAQSQVMWFKKISAATTINVVFTQPAPMVDVKWAVYHDIDQTNPIAGNVSQGGTSTTADSGALSLNSPAVLVASSASRAPIGAADPGFTMRLGSSGGVLQDADATAGVFHATSPLSSANDWIIQLVALRPN